MVQDSYDTGKGGAAFVDLPDVGDLMKKQKLQARPQDLGNDK